MPDPKFTGGSPISDPNNPYGRGATSEERTVLGSLPVEARGDMALDDLAVESEAITDQEASGRPANPPSIGGIEGAG